MLKIKKFASADPRQDPSDGQEPEGKKEEEASSSEGEYIEYITKNDFTECPLERRSEEREASLRYREHSAEGTESISSNGQESLNMRDLGLPLSFKPSQRRTGERQDTFRCTVCEVTLTSAKTMEDHMNGKNHLKKSHALKQKNSEQILNIVAVSNPPSTRLSKVFTSLLFP